MVIKKTLLVKLKIDFHLQNFRPWVPYGYIMKLRPQPRRRPPKARETLGPTPDKPPVMFDPTRDLIPSDFDLLCVSSTDDQRALHYATALTAFPDRAAGSPQLAELNPEFLSLEVYGGVTRNFENKVLAAALLKQHLAPEVVKAVAARLKEYLELTQDLMPTNREELMRKMETWVASLVLAPELTADIKQLVDVHKSEVVDYIKMVPFNSIVFLYRFNGLAFLLYPELRQEFRLSASDWKGMGIAFMRDHARDHQDFRDMHSFSEVVLNGMIVGNPYARIENGRIEFTPPASEIGNSPALPDRSAV